MIGFDVKGMLIAAAILFCIGKSRPGLNGSIAHSAIEPFSLLCSDILLNGAAWGYQ